MSDLKLYLFGEPRFESAGAPLLVDRRKAFALCAYLALAEQRQNRDVLAALLWPELDQERAHAALRTTLHTLGSINKDDWLDKDRTTLTLNQEVIWIDVLAFQSLLRLSRLHKHEANTLCEQCLEALLAAVNLYRADFMARYSASFSTEYELWQAEQQEWLRRELAYALKRLANYYGELGDFENALAYANRWLAIDPLHEPAHRMLMSLYSANGQRAAALRQYQQCVELLDIELATPPDEETNRLYAAIQSEGGVTSATMPGSLRQNASVLPVLPSLVVGRESNMHEIKQRLGMDGEMRPVTVIQGWPGVGKSTLMAALAHDPTIAQLFPDGVLWASLGESPNLLAELNIWVKTVGISDPGVDRKLETLVSQLVTVLRDRRMLLIVDDIWQVEHAAPFKVGGQACALVMTTRLNEVAQALAPTAYDSYHLPVLAQDDALELLKRLTPETVSEHPVESAELVHDLEGLPLAIQVAGRLLHTEARLGWSVSELLTELREGARILEAQAPADMLKLGQETSPTIAALLKRSTDSLSDELRQQFALLGLFIPKPATFDLGAMAAAWDVSDPKPIARKLVNRGLLEPVSGGRFQMHALLVLHARSLLAEITG